MHHASPGTIRESPCHVRSGQTGRLTPLGRKSLSTSPSGISTKKGKSVRTVRLNH